MYLQLRADFSLLLPDNSFTFSLYSSCIFFSYYDVIVLEIIIREQCIKRIEFDITDKAVFFVIPFVKVIISVHIISPAKRIFGVGTGLKEVPEKATVRIPTSEIRPYSSTGGMSIVPKEIADNLAKLVAGKQDVKVIVDSPLYLGRTEKDTFLELVDDKSNGIFRWMKTSFDKKKGEYKTEQLAKLELIDTFKVPVHTDSGIVDETVRMFRTENNVVMDIEELKAQMSPKTLAEVEETIKKGGTFESKGLTIRTDSDGNVKAYAKVQNIFYDKG